MDSVAACRPSVRSLREWEIEEVRDVFGNQLKYGLIRIHECTTWTNSMDRLGRWLKRMPPVKTQNALTLGNHCFFPVRLLDKAVPLDFPEHYKIGWLIHELTHAWQFQKLGWRYLVMALRAQFRGKDAAYDFGNAQGLKMHRKDGWTLQKFNLEQQGEITRTYHDRLRKGEDVSDWLPYIHDIQGIV